MQAFHERSRRQDSALQHSENPGNTSKGRSDLMFPVVFFFFNWLRSTAFGHSFSLSNTIASSEVNAMVEQFCYSTACAPCRDSEGHSCIAEFSFTNSLFRQLQDALHSKRGILCTTIGAL